MSRAKSRSFGLVPHRMSAIFHDNGRLVVSQHMRQRLHQDFGLFLRAGLKLLGHGRSGRRGALF